MHIACTIGNNGRALRSVEMRLPANGLVCLMGRNGSGKSTLLRTIAGLQTPITGAITYENVVLNTLSKEQLARKVSIVLTKRVEAEQLTVEEIVGMGRAPYTGFFGRLSATDREIVAQAIDNLGIRALAKRRIRELSDGEHQKAMIARALAQTTDIIIMDEPTAFLDYESRVQLMVNMKSLAKKESKLILMSTHDLHLAEEYADHIVRLD